MRRLVVGIVLCSWASGWAVSAQAQGRGATDWMTNHGDAQRSSWIRTDAKISKDTLQKPGFQFLWKLKLKNEPNQLNSLRQPILLELLIGYRGFRALGFVAGSSNKLFAVDTDLGRMEWQKQLPLSAPPAGAAPSPSASLACPGGMTAGVTRPTLATFPSALAGGSGFGGRRSPARSAVGDPGQGAVTLAQVRPTPPVPAPAPVAPAKPPAPSLPSLFGRGPFLIHALSSDGMLHTMHLSNGADAEPPARFVPPNADAQGLIVVDNAAYVMTQGGCGGVPNGVWALDLASKQVATWKGHVSGSAG
ncbi:MAG TPA: hypothetical protein VJ302_18070, partial [Blastocatellia bacterium]|nr:hypothetical protein [Blastocatellia bacterium]